MPESQTPLILLDGGLGTTLADNHACTFNETHPLWSSDLLVTDQATLLAAQTSFAAAGADIILSATYQASYEGFRDTIREDKQGVGEQEAGELMRRGVAIVGESFAASGRKGTTALSLGAYGATMRPGQEYTGFYDELHRGVHQLRAWHLKRLLAFLRPTHRQYSDAKREEEEERKRCWESVEYVAFETLPLVVEIEAVRLVMGDVGKVTEGEGKRFWIACVFPGDGNGLPDGSGVGDVVRTMLARKEGQKVPFGVGINCTKVTKIETLIEEFEVAIGEMVGNGEAKWPSLVVYPDGTDGEVYDTSTKEWVKNADGGGSGMPWDEEVFEIVRRARERGVWKSIVVGGCCKVTPEGIGRLRRRIDGDDKAS